MTKAGKKFYIADGKGGVGMASKPRLDMQGEPFSKPTLYLPADEYKRVYSEIGTHYDNHRSRPISQIEIEGTTYVFENRRFGDYNIFDKW